MTAILTSAPKVAQPGAFQTSARAVGPIFFKDRTAAKQRLGVGLAQFPRSDPSEATVTEVRSLRFV